MAIATTDLAFADLIGLPFKKCARGPDFFDCYGLAMEMQSRLGRKVPDYASPETAELIHDAIIKNRELWIACGPVVGAIAAIRIGRDVTHVATVLPFGRMIHSWEKSGGVCVEKLSEWERRIVGFYQYPQ